MSCFTFFSVWLFFTSRECSLNLISLACSRKVANCLVSSFVPKFFNSSIFILFLLSGDKSGFNRQFMGSETHGFRGLIGGYAIHFKQNTALLHHGHKMI